MAIALHFCLRDRVSLKRNALVAGFGFAFVWSFFNNYTVSLMRFSAMFMRSQLVFQFCLCALCAALFVGGRLRAAKPWYLLHAVILLAFLVGNGFWSSAYPDLWARRFNTREGSRQLEQLIPPDAIVIGRRATTLLRASQARLGMTTSNYQPKEFVEKVASLLDKYPSHPLYWLVDGDKNSSWQWNAYLQQGQEQWKVRLAATVSIATGDVFSTGDMPDADDLMLVPVYLFRVTKLP